MRRLYVDNREKLTNQDLLNDDRRLDHEKLLRALVKRQIDRSRGFTFSVCFPGVAVQLVMIFTPASATNPSTPSHCAGSEPGADGGINATVCGVWSSIWTASLSGLSGPKLFKVGATKTVVETFPLLSMVLKLTKSYSLQWRSKK